MPRLREVDVVGSPPCTVACPLPLGLAVGVATRTSYDVAGLAGTADITHNKRRGLMSAVARWSGHTSEEAYLLIRPIRREVPFVCCKGSISNIVGHV